MSATISVVVPTFNSEHHLRQCLKSIENQSYRPANVVVCDGGSTDTTASIAIRFGATLVYSTANRSAQRNAGALKTHGDYVLFIDSDMMLTSNVLRECVETFRKSDAALTIPEVDVGRSYWARVRGFERSFYSEAWWLHAARCYRRSQFLEIGGFDVGLIGPEDWDLDERIRCFGDIRDISAVIEHDEGRLGFGDLVRKKQHYSSSFSKFRSRHPERAALCFGMHRRALLFAKRPARLAAHPVLTFGLATIGFTELMASHGWIDYKMVDSMEQILDASQNPLLFPN